MTQERMTDAYAAKVTAEKEAGKLTNADGNKVDEKRESGKPCTVTINTSPSVSLRHMYKLTYSKYGVMDECGVLVMQ